MFGYFPSHMYYTCLAFANRPGPSSGLIWVRTQVQPTSKENLQVGLDNRKPTPSKAQIFLIDQQSVLTCVCQVNSSLKKKIYVLFLFYFQIPIWETLKIQLSNKENFIKRDLRTDIIRKGSTLSISSNWSKEIWQAMNTHANIKNWNLIVT